jgi:hypothetical protein
VQSIGCVVSFKWINLCPNTAGIWFDRFTGNSNKTLSQCINFYGLLQRFSREEARNNLVINLFKPFNINFSDPHVVFKMEEYISKNNIDVWYIWFCFQF